MQHEIKDGKNSSVEIIPGESHYKGLSPGTNFISKGLKGVPGILWGDKKYLTFGMLVVLQAYSTGNTHIVHFKLMWSVLHINYTSIKLIIKTKRKQNTNLWCLHEN